VSRPASAQDWQDVDDLEDFVAYLRLLAGEAELAEQSSGSWRNTTIPDFLAAIDSLLALDEEPDARGSNAVTELTMTTWRELAALLRTATTTPAAASTDAGAKNGDAKSVNSLADLRSYLRWLIEDFRLDMAEVAERTRADPWGYFGRWAHGVLSIWLERWAAWLEGCYLSPLPALMVKLGIQREPVEPMSWRSIAIQMSGARIYE
jgi:hypothetical protein